MANAILLEHLSVDETSRLPVVGQPLKFKIMNGTDGETAGITAVTI